MTTMRTTKFSALRLAAVMAVLPGTLLAAVCAPAWAQTPKQKRFTTAKEAVHALFAAVKERDNPAVKTILGPQITRLISDDKPQEERDRKQFIEKYQEMRRLVKEPDGRTMLYIGAENWPFPIPLVSTKAGWRFDTDAGIDEILCRRIGEDEASVIAAFHALTGAQKQKIENSKTPLHGYYFHTVNSAAHHSTKTTSGFLVAYPVDYRVTGVMTFLFSPKGVVYEKDLGANTLSRVKAMTRYPINATWIAAK